MKPESTQKRHHIYPTMQQVVAEKQEAPKKNYQPIRVDNWGIFLLSRLQNYFTKKELCDLTLRFPAQNAQIKVHKLIMNACTEYFSRLEKESLSTAGSEPGYINMPGNFTPEALAPIIRFMYTGRLDLKESSYAKMYETAQTLQMSVLTKLMDAQVNTPNVNGEAVKRPVKRNNSAFDEDPVEQMRKIRKIEKRVAQEEKRRMAAVRARQEELARLPGRKLPIWKRKVPDHAVSTPPIIAESSVQEEQKMFSPSKDAMSTSGYRIPRVSGMEGSRTVASLLSEHLEHSEEESRRPEQPAGQLIPPPVVSTTYRKRSPGEKPKIPRRLQEIQQHLMFEKILKTGTKNTVTKPLQTSEPEKSNDLSLEEVKALVEEQKQRMAAVNEEDEDEDDYYDDSVDIGDDYIDADVDSPAPVESPSEDVPQAVAEPEAQKKSVRFSLRPTPKLSSSEPDPLTPKIEPVSSLGSIVSTSWSNVSSIASSTTTTGKSVTGESVSSETSSSGVSNMMEVSINVPSEVSSQEDQEKQQISLTLPEPGPKSECQSELDEALEEFSRVAEEEAEELREGEDDHNDPGLMRRVDHTRPRRGRPPRWLKEHTMQMGEFARRREDGGRESSLSTNCYLPDQSQVINEVMKKYPDLFKNNKQVKLKVMTKDITGRPVTKLITLKSHPSPIVGSGDNQIHDGPVPAGIGSLKPITKVMYTGKRGRPKKVKPGMHDPHIAERKQIEARLLRDYPALANQISREDNGEEEEDGAEEYEEDYKQEYSQLEAGGHHAPAASNSQSQSLDPSSEAEALSNVASGIAASLGLVEQQYQAGAGGQQVMVQDGQLVLAPATQVGAGGGGQQQQEYIQVLNQSSQLGHTLQYSLAKDPRLQGMTVAPGLSLPQGLIPVSSAMYATAHAQTLLPVTSDHVMSSDLTQAGGSHIVPIVVSTGTIVASQPHMMIQSSAQMLLPASSMLGAGSAGIVVMSPHLVQSGSQILGPTVSEQSPPTSLPNPPSKAVTKIVSDWDSEEDN